MDGIWSNLPIVCFTRLSRQPVGSGRNWVGAVEVSGVFKNIFSLSVNVWIATAKQLIYLWYYTISSFQNCIFYFAERKNKISPSLNLVIIRRLWYKRNKPIHTRNHNKIQKKTTKMSLQRVSSVLSGLKQWYNEINPATLTGAIDVIVVEQADGTFVSSPFHVRFGKLGVLKAKEKIVSSIIFYYYF